MAEHVRYRMTTIGLFGLAIVIPGCAAPTARQPMFTPMTEAIAIVRANRALVTAGLQASGSVWLAFHDDTGRKRHADLDGTLQVLPPTHLRFALKNALGGDEFEFGMNTHKWWIVVQRPERRQFEGPLGEFSPEIDAAVPLRPDQFIQALGLNDPSGTEAAQRVVDDYQQLVFFAPGPELRWTIEREVWLDRYEPRLIRRVLFRDEQGLITLSSELDDYRPVGTNGLQLPHTLRLDWPAEDAAMVFKVRRWRERGNLISSHRAFVFPR